MSWEVTTIDTGDHLAWNADGRSISGNVGMDYKGTMRKAVWKREKIESGEPSLRMC